MSNVFTVKSCKGELVNQSIFDYFASKHLLDNIIHNCIFHIKDLQFTHTGKYDLPNFKGSLSIYIGSFLFVILISYK